MITLCKFPGECDSERILKIGQYLRKICIDNVGLLFGPPCIFTRSISISCLKFGCPKRVKLYCSCRINC